jgi:hypothetical protein
MDQEKLDSAAQVTRRQKQQTLWSLSIDRSGTPNRTFIQWFSEYSAENCDQILDQLYDQSGFRLWGGAFKDILLNSKANRATHDVWAKRTHQRIQDPV